MKKLQYGRWMIAAVAVFSLVVAGGVVNAMPSVNSKDTPDSRHAQEAQDVKDVQQTAAEHQATERGTVADKKEVEKPHLANAKLKVCQTHEKEITNITTRFSDRGTKQLDVFNKIADRTEAFYTSKGKTLSNYDTLVADVTSKKASAQAAVNTVTSSSTTFKCDGTDPKGMATSFKDSLKVEITALKDYKTAIKNLIVGVKSVESTTATTTATTTGGAKQ